MYHEWKVGDKVVWWPGNDYVMPELKTIERVTPSGVAVIGIKYYKPNGWVRGVNSWVSERIEPGTEEAIKRMDEIREEMTAEWRLRVLGNKLHKIPWHTLPLETLEAVWKMVGGENG